MPSLPANEGAAPAVWTEPLTVHSYDVDLSQRVSLETLCRYFQEAAWNHAERLGVGYRRLQEQNQFWVLSRLLMIIQRGARWGETLVIHTWPRHAKSVFAMRDFEFLDSTGIRVAAGTSGWLVLDARTRRPQRVDKLVASFPVLPERRALAEDPEKLPQLGIVAAEARRVEALRESGMSQPNPLLGSPSPPLEERAGERRQFREESAAGPTPKPDASPSPLPKGRGPGREVPLCSLSYSPLSIPPAAPSAGTPASLETAPQHPAADLGGCGPTASVQERPVRYSDLDVNHHVNGARYVGWLLDSYPLDFLRAHIATKLEINYLGETKAGETATLVSQAGAGGEVLHSVFTGAGEACRARLRWTLHPS